MGRNSQEHVAGFICWCDGLRVSRSKVTGKVGTISSRRKVKMLCIVKPLHQGLASLQRAQSLGATEDTL